MLVLDFRPQHALTIGGRAIPGKHTWDGLIDNVRLSNKALAAEDLGDAAAGRQDAVSASLSFSPCGRRWQPKAAG